MPTDATVAQVIELLQNIVTHSTVTKAKYGSSPAKRFLHESQPPGLLNLVGREILCFLFYAHAFLANVAQHEILGKTCSDRTSTHLWNRWLHRNLNLPSDLHKFSKEESKLEILGRFFKNNWLYIPLKLNVHSGKAHAIYLFLFCSSNSFKSEASSRRYHMWLLRRGF